METTVGVYDSYEKAIKALEKIKAGGFPAKQISLVSKAEMKNNHMHVNSHEGLDIAELSIGLAVGPVLGILTGVGLFAIPGFGFLFGAGAIVGALAGFDIGLIGAGALSFLTFVGVELKHHKKYQDHLNAGNFLLIAHGSPAEVQIAHEILESHGNHIELNKH